MRQSNSIEIIDNPELLLALLRNIGKRIIFRPTEARMLNTMNNLQQFIVTVRPMATGRKAVP